jgi:hypothetical protein
MLLSSGQPYATGEQNQRIQADPAQPLPRTAVGLDAPARNGARGSGQRAGSSKAHDAVQSHGVVRCGWTSRTHRSHCSDPRWISVDCNPSRFVQIRRYALHSMGTEFWRTLARRRRHCALRGTGWQPLDGLPFRGRQPSVGRTSDKLFSQGWSSGQRNLHHRGRQR